MQNISNRTYLSLFQTFQNQNLLQQRTYCIQHWQIQLLANIYVFYGIIGASRRKLSVNVIQFDVIQKSF